MPFLSGLPGSRAALRPQWLPLLCCLYAGLLSAQTAIDARTFEAASPEERYQLIHHFNFDGLDSAAFTAAYDPLMAVAVQKKDYRSSLALRYYRFRERKKLRLSADQITALLTGLGKDADAHGFIVENAVARHFAVFEAYNQGKIPQEQMYAEILKEFEQLKSIGFEKFRDYDIARMLFHSSAFMYELEDFDKALQYLAVAEQFIEPGEAGWQTYILVLNYLQTIYQKQKSYELAIAYAKKILDFCQNLHPSDPQVAKNCQVWEGLASIDIASMLIEQHRPEEAGQYISRGYALARSDPNALQAEYDALQVLISIKLELGQLDETAVLLQRVKEINTILDKTPVYFKHIRFYNSCARFYQMKGDFATAFQYLQNARILEDSLKRRNDAWKYQKIQQRLEAEQYLAKLDHLESEKQLQKWLRNAALLILGLVLTLAYVNFKRLQAKRRQALAELQMARHDLEAFAQSSREKSELVDSLRLELEKLSARGEHSEYLEQLSRATILTDEDWARFRSLFEKVHPGFIARQKEQLPDLTPAEIRLLALEKLHMNTQEIANMLGVSRNTIHQTRSRLRRKAGI